MHGEGEGEREEGTANANAFTHLQTQTQAQQTVANMQHTNMRREYGRDKTRQEEGRGRERKLVGAARTADGSYACSSWSVIENV